MYPFNMSVETATSRKCCWTFWTTIRLLLPMYGSNVCIEIHLHAEVLCALLAAEGFLPAMDYSDMSIQIRWVKECLRALCTSECLLAMSRSYVHQHVTTITTCFWALGACDPFFEMYGIDMLQKVVLPREAFPTMRALEWFEVCMRSLMCFIVGRIGECFPTDRTLNLSTSGILLDWFPSVCRCLIHTWNYWRGWLS